ncbi:response regulator [Phenylobacterium sp.]|uniref:response regulator n=1 Tax=Phenylobacterium sp. TaxID=1871053 RepID=UPI00121AD390|nr:response regulator [Phenylobacterium sp.]THD57916.1 MAG: response regulator [Phenylobacterium sp.]
MRNPPPTPAPKPAKRPVRPLAERRPRRAQINAEQLASLSHEFRTPLNGVLGMSRLLESTRLTAEQRAYAAAIRDSGEHLLNLVNDVLDFAKLGAGKIELHHAEVEAEALLRGVCELLSPRAREKGIEIAWSAPANLGAIRVDDGRLRQILLNFAGNAVKFTEAGGVRLGVERAGRGRLRFTVDDTGPGVSANQRERIFEAFAQADPAHAHLGGAGLGLAIARRLALAMDGEVGMQPRSQGGSRFWFEAPFLAAGPATAAPGLAGRKVGVVSPNPVVREAAAQQIDACGGVAVTAETLEALLARTQFGDVILVDHALAPGSRLLRRPPERRAIILLAPEDRALIGRYRRSGFAGYLIKPLRRASLAERVLIAAGAEQGLAAGVEDERIATAAAPGKRVLLVEDNPINALLARALLTREGCEIDHASGGEEAIAAVKVGAYDLILMDMRMPGLNGVETTRALRALGVETPIVALTANAFEDDRHACLAAGMNDFLVKPMSPDALRSTLTRWTGPGWTETLRRAKVG